MKPEKIPERGFFHFYLNIVQSSGLSQKELARKLDTTQSVVARIEAGQQNFTTDTLQKIASAFKRELKIEFVK